MLVMTGKILVMTVRMLVNGKKLEMNGRMLEVNGRMQVMTARMLECCGARGQGGGVPAGLSRGRGGVWCERRGALAWRAAGTLLHCHHHHHHYHVNKATTTTEIPWLRHSDVTARHARGPASRSPYCFTGSMPRLLHCA